MRTAFAQINMFTLQANITFYYNIYLFNVHHDNINTVEIGLELNFFTLFSF